MLLGAEGYPFTGVALSQFFPEFIRSNPMYDIFSPMSKPAQTQNRQTQPQQTQPQPQSYIPQQGPNSLRKSLHSMGGQPFGARSPSKSNKTFNPPSFIPQGDNTNAFLPQQSYTQPIQSYPTPTPLYTGTGFQQSNTGGYNTFVPSNVPASVPTPSFTPLVRPNPPSTFYPQQNIPQPVQQQQSSPVIQPPKPAEPEFIPGPPLDHHVIEKLNETVSGLETCNNNPVYKYYFLD